MNRRHDQSGGNALSGDIANNQAQATIRKEQEIVEIAANLTRRTIVWHNLPAGESRHIFGQKGVLNRLRRAQFLLDAFALAYLLLLLLHHLRHAQRRGNLRAQRVEQYEVFMRIFLPVQTRHEQKQEHSDHPVSEQIALLASRLRTLKRCSMSDWT
jgi:hypothetical protein